MEQPDNIFNRTSGSVCDYDDSRIVGEKMYDELNFKYFVSKLSYHQTFNIIRTLVGNNIVDDSDVVGASPVGAAPTTAPFST